MMTKKSDASGDPGRTAELEQEAPGDLWLLSAFLNTDLEGRDTLVDWLKHSGLLAPGTELGDSDLERAIEVRDATRTLIARNSAAAVPLESLSPPQSRQRAPE